MAKRKTPINYTARDFDSIKDELVQYAKDITQRLSEISIKLLLARL